MGCRHRQTLNSIAKNREESRSRHKGIEHNEQTVIQACEQLLQLQIISRLKMSNIHKELLLEIREYLWTSNMSFKHSNGPRFLF